MDDAPFDDEQLEKSVRAAMGRLDASAQRCGLYLGGVRVAVPEEGHGPALVIADFEVGGLAFTERVLNPQSEEGNKTLRALEVDDDLDRFIEARRRLEESLQPDAAEDDDER